MGTSHVATAWLPADWESMSDPPGQRFELLHGSLSMSPSPQVGHQIIARNLANLLDGAAPGYMALMDTEWRILSPDGDYVLHAPRPDVMVLSIEHATSVDFPTEAPLIVCEINSPSNTRHEKAIKRQLYLDNGVAWFIEVDFHQPRSGALNRVQSVDLTIYEARTAKDGVLSWLPVRSVSGQEILRMQKPWRLSVRPGNLLWPV